MGESRTIHFVSLGCAKNRVDTEVMLGVSDQSGFAIVDDPAEAEVIVINTCGFIGPAKEESIDTILEMSAHKASGSCEKLVVAGCLSQRYPDELSRELPEVDHFLGSSDMLKLETVLGGAKERMLVGNPAQYTMRASDPRLLSGQTHRAYVKIAEGCNRECSFCAIPSFRGKQRSRTIEDLVREAGILAAAGVVELNLISQDTIAYGRDLAKRESLDQLLAALAEVDGIRWIRAHYLYPEKLSDALIETIAQQEKVLPYIDMPLQHASDSMLRAMRRGHGGERMYKVVERLRRAIPDLVFRTTFIVGHPGETDEDFEELRSFVEWAEFDHVGVFLYSPEEGTPSGEMPDPVDSAVAKARHQALMDVQRPISRERLELRVGTELDVLVEGVSDESDFLLQGRWWGQAPEVDGTVYLANGTAQMGEIRRVLVTDAADYDLMADFIDGPSGRDAPPDAKDPRQAKVKLTTLP
ncbi:MAG: 30S ribosomal protein S12 methylthiotransferase RimO [Deltaproteobacteria bacterium]|nr:30S ribosomal protein S12 methylthiotransferase RimO [Deltaproteobacteria bacterium]NND29900.1 30S ribosomal protein S12 methylthiotransferase RimO [Myxococcales bacterium]MBT8463901.1 30S ribosomal protein S12 methylthiotransferase RimO [Deltaproteobacteria bacterium]MBT8481670.1 30S ribosomal protein S12 methylthiotransferase RimO [Deltaproteobacteria bacterium]NNK08882.1 30S ribosomal protein S12 methylthiotransferase RimO [Myxococcales bacterium]